MKKQTKHMEKETYRPRYLSTLGQRDTFIPVVEICRLHLSFRTCTSLEPLALRLRISRSIFWRRLMLASAATAKVACPSVAETLTVWVRRGHFVKNARGEK